jgi:hypothetical protein
LPSEVAATEAYLSANDTLSRAVLENVPASLATTRAFIQTLGRECAGVLAGLPREDALLRPGHLPTPREEGEARRRGHQLAEVELWEQTALLDSLYAPDAGATRNFIQTVALLRWSDLRINEGVRENIGALEETLAAPSASTVCAALRGWQQSGYRTLPQAAGEAEAHLDNSLAANSLKTLLAPYEHAHGRALQRQITALGRRFASKLEALDMGVQGLLRTLGLREEGPEGASAGATLIGHGHTVDGGSYTFRVQPHTAESGCPLEVDFQSTSAPSGHHHFTSISGTTECLTDSERRVRATVNCQPSEGVIEVQAWLPGDTRNVRLGLNDGRTVTSRAAVVPVRLGGPLALYYQALRGPFPYPVSLTALDAHGGVLRTLGLRPVRDCKAEPPHRRSRKLIFTELARGTTTTGAPFTVTGELVSFGRHRHSFNVNLSVRGNGEGGSGPGGKIELLPAHSPEAAARLRDAQIFSPKLADECPPHEYAIVYGLLSAPGETVLARTPSGLTPLTEVAIPKRLKTHGLVAYGSFPTIPTEVVVQGAGGKTLFSESLAGQAREHAEFCEGYAE